MMETQGAVATFEQASLKQAFLARVVLTAVLVVVLLVCFGWSSALSALIAGAGASALGWIAWKSGVGPRAQMIRYALIALEVALVTLAVFFGDLFDGNPPPPAPMVFYSPIALLLVCVLAVNAISARASQVLWTGGCIIADWWIAAQIVLADPATLTKEKMESLSPDSLIDMLAIGARPHYFNRDVFTLEWVSVACCTIVLAFAAYRTRAIATRAAQQHALRSGLAAHFSGPVIDALLAARAAKAGATRTLAVIDCDLVDFSARARVMTPEAVAGALRVYHGFVENLVFAHGGGVLKFTGDGVTAVFGMTGDPVTAAAAAVACAARIVGDWPAQARTAFPDDDAPVSIGVGVDAGEVTAGIAGEGRAMSLMVAGAPVDGAAALQAATRATKVNLLVSKTVVDLAAQAPDLSVTFAAVKVTGLRAFALKGA